MDTKNQSNATKYRGHATILFDGVCNLCTWSVQFIIERDPAGYFRFASLQSEIGHYLAAQCGVDTDSIDSFVLLEEGQCYIRSDAGLRVARHLSGWWPVLSLLRIMPRRVRDRLYDVIANNRYRWFGQRDSCMMPTPDRQQRFL